MRATSSLNSSNTPPGQYLTNETLVQTRRQPSAGTETASITKTAPAPDHRPETAQDQRANQAWQSSEDQRHWTDAVSPPGQRCRRWTNSKKTTAQVTCTPGYKMVLSKNPCELCFVTCIQKLMNGALGHLCTHIGKLCLKNLLGVHAGNNLQPSKHNVLGPVLESLLLFIN